jgi:glyoxylase I family protein
MGIEIRGMAPRLQVFDMPTSIAFYRDVPGFEVLAASKPGAEHRGWALLRRNGTELMPSTA